MSKVLSPILSILSLFAGLLLFISFLLTSEKSLKFFLNINQDAHVEFFLSDSHWHPYKPSIEIDVLSLERPGEESKQLEIKGLNIGFNLFSSFQGNLIESLHAKYIDVLIYPSSNDTQINLKDLWLYVSSIKNLRIDDFSITDSVNNLDTLRGELSSIALKSGDSRVRFTGKNTNGGNLEFRMNSILGSKSLKDYRGFLRTSNFSLNQEIISQSCPGCPNGTLDSEIWFTLIDLKLVKFLGDMKLKFNSSFDFINSINAKVKLEDQKNNIFRISSFINENPKNIAPEIFASFANEETVFFVPEIELGKDKFINKLQHLFNLPKHLLIKGYITNLTFGLYDSFKFRADFEDLYLKSNELSVAGLEGNFRYTKDVSRLKINTPYLRIDLGTLFDNPVVFNNLSSKLDLNLVDKKVSISNSTFKGTYKQALIKGEVNLFPSPIDDTGDLSLKISSANLNYLDALSLFPNSSYTKLTKNWLQNAISCGSLEEVSLIYRGPIDNKYNDSSSSFLSKGFVRDSCLNINDVDVKDINLAVKINNSSFLGEVLNGDLYGSEIKGIIKIFKDNNSYKLELKGDSKGPLLSILRLSNLNKIFEAEEESGEHYTNFYFISPLSTSLDILGKNSNLELTTKIKGGNFNNKKTELYFSDLYSSIEYDSLNGIKDGFATIKINNIPIKFDIRKGKENGSFYTQLIAEDYFSAKRILSSYDIKKDIRGSSKFNLKLTLASFIKDQPFLSPKIEVSSNLEGISINLPEPLVKAKDSIIDFRLTFKPSLDETPTLSFNYGDLFRGKLNFLNNTTEGFVIAGKKRQSISIADEKILLVGQLQKLDLGSLMSLGVFEGEGASNFFIKDLIVQETNFSNLSLSKTRFKSSRTQEGVEYKFINDELSGVLLVPEDDKRNLSFKFDFIKINQSSNEPKESFLSLYNSINAEFDFSTEAIFFNGKNYGNWEFSILPENNKLTFHSIKGVYGKLGLKTTNEGKSSLEIFKNSIGWTSSLKTNIYSGSPEKAMIQIGIKPNFELDTLSLDTDLTWNNLPWLFDYNSITGEISTNLEGLTIKDNEDLDTPNNLLRLVNIFNITDSFEKITNLDFRKLYKRGFRADSVTGKFKITAKRLEIKEPILIKSGSSQFSWNGEISKDKKGNLDRLNLEVVMTLPLREYLPAYALVLGGPITAGIVYIAGKAFERNLDKLSSGKWTIEGNISEPKTTFDGWFEENTEK